MKDGRKRTGREGHGGLADASGPMIETAVRQLLHYLIDGVRPAILSGWAGRLRG